MKTHLSAEKGVSLVEAAIVLPILLIALIASFSMAQFAFMGSRMIQYATASAVTLKAATGIGQPILDGNSSTLTDYNDLIISSDDAMKANQVSWYEHNTANGINTSNSQQMTFLNVMLGYLKTLAPNANIPPEYVNDGSGYKTVYTRNGKPAYEISLQSTNTPGSDTTISIVTEPSFFSQMLMKLIGMSNGQPYLLRASTKLISDATSTFRMGSALSLSGTALAVAASSASSYAGGPSSGHNTNQTATGGNNGGTSFGTGLGGGGNNSLTQQ